jgi:hypothetical protein
MQPFPFFSLPCCLYLYDGRLSKYCPGLPWSAARDPPGGKMLLTSTSGAAWDEDEELAGCQRISRLLCGCLP